MDNKNYNSTREKLILPEYGRNVVSMVNELLKIDNRTERSRQAALVIEVMGNINPTLRDSAAYSHKLWDHLYVLSDFKLDIDAPYEKPLPESLEVKPERIPYVRNQFSHKQYGNNIRKVIEVLCQEPDKELVDTVAVDLAKFMRQKSYEFNQEYPSNEVIINDMSNFSGGDIRLDEDALSHTYVYRNKPKINKPIPSRNNSNTLVAKGGVGQGMKSNNSQQRRPIGGPHTNNNNSLNNSMQRKRVITFKKK